MRRPKEWNLKPEEIKQFVEMIESAPWKLVNDIFVELERSGQRDLENEQEMFTLARAQGTILAIKKIRSRINTLLETYKEDTNVKES